MSDPATHATQPIGTWTPDGEVIARPGETALLDAIATIYDPEIPVNIYELGLIYAVEIADDGAVKVEMTLTAPGCPSAQELPVQVREAVLGVPGVAAAAGGTGWGPPRGPRRKSDDPRLALNMF